MNSVFIVSVPGWSKACRERTHGDKGCEKEREASVKESKFVHALFSSRHKLIECRITSIRIGNGGGKQQHELAETKFGASLCVSRGVMHRLPRCA